MKSIKDVLGKFSYGSSRNYTGKSSRELKEVFDFFSLIKQWESIVGEKLAQKTMPLGIYKDQLVVITNHSAFSEQLSFMEKVLIEKVVNKFPSLQGKLKRMTFKYDSQKFHQQSEMLNNISEKSELEQIIHPFSPEYKHLKSKAEELLFDIEDEELKRQMTSIFIQSAIKK